MLLPSLLLALFQEEVAPSLLAPIPEGWRTERLEFPLSFAPDLAYRGFEDLAFAPGMFVPGSDSYFTYALALRLEGEIAVDEAMLTDFLERYYRGLCVAVATERELEHDASRIRARVWRDEEIFGATIEMFDPFTSGDALDLELELHAHQTPRATEILGLASAVEHEAPIWEELHALGAAWHRARPAPVLLNHAFFVVDAATYRALAADPFLRAAFAVGEERTTVRGDLSYTGLYLYGERTYFEFLPPTPAAGLVEGATGLALGTEVPGALDALAARLGAAGIATQGGPITRAFEEKPVPWFQILGVEMPAGPLQLFAMEYDPRFFAGWHSDQPPRRRSRERAAMLERYAGALEELERRRTAPFAEVREVRLSLDAAQRERLLAFAAVAGWELEEPEAASGGGALTVLAPQFRLRLAESSVARGLTGLELELRTPVERAPLVLGRSTWTFAGASARLDLAP